MLLFAYLNSTTVQFSGNEMRNRGQYSYFLKVFTSAFYFSLHYDTKQEI